MDLILKYFRIYQNEALRSKQLRYYFKNVLLTHSFPLLYILKKTAHKDSNQPISQYPLFLKWAAFNFDKADQR